jgi:type I restriction enzyme R subunit
MPVLFDRPDVIVLTDAAPRSQCDTLALNMRAALPKALFLAFTGTPIIAGEELTKDVFGDYVSIYDIQQSVEDGATVPLFYENRTPELQLVNPNLNEDIYNLIEEAQLDPGQEAKLERELSRQYHHPHPRRAVGDSRPGHREAFPRTGFIGKGMVVSIDTATALRMHDKVQKHWVAELERVQKEIAELTRYPAAADVRRLKSFAPEKSEPPHVGCYYLENMRELQRRRDVGVYCSGRLRDWTQEIISFNGSLQQTARG